MANQKKIGQSTSASNPFTGGTFSPPPDYKESDGWPDSPPDGDTWKSPIAFKITDVLPPDPPIRSLRHLLRRHRLLFLWAATPVHGALVPGDPQTDKATVLKHVGVTGSSEPANRPAEEVVDHEQHLERWLAELQRHLGHGREGKWAMYDRAPHDLPKWRLGPNAETSLHDSLVLIRRSVGSVLSSTLPRWLGDDDVPAIRACARAAEPTSLGEPRPSWEYPTLVTWDYPDLVASATAELDRLVDLEQSPEWDPNQDTVRLVAPGMPPILLGRRRKPLTDLQYRIVSGMIAAGTDGLSKDELLAIGGGFRRSLENLRKSDPDWEKVIVMPRKAWRGYRLLLRLPGS